MNSHNLLLAASLPRGCCTALRKQECRRPDRLQILLLLRLPLTLPSAAAAPLLPLTLPQAAAGCCSGRAAG